MFYKDGTGNFPQRMMDAAERDKSYNALGNHLNYFIVALFSLFYRGKTEELPPHLDAVTRTRNLIPTNEKGQRAVNIFAITPQATILRGDFPAAAKEINEFDELVGDHQGEHTRDALRIQTKLLFLLEQREFGPEIENLISKFRSLPFDLFWIALNYVRFSTVLIGYIRLEQIHQQQDPAKIKELILDLKKEMRRIASCRDFLTVPHREVLKAGLLAVEGKQKPALRALQKAEDLAILRENDWALYECSKIRARIYHKSLKEQERNLATLEIARAIQIAQQKGWLARIEVLTRELNEWRGITEVSKPATQSASHGSSGFRHRESRMDSTHSEHQSVKSALAERQLHALLEVSLASAESLNPEIQTQKIMASLIGILGAERAILFLTDPASGGLRLSASRNLSGEALTSATPYSTRVVEKVFETRSSLIISGDEEAKSIGAESAIRFGLRSIIASPLMVQERLIGVVYLDSRLAKGVFSQANLEILQALSQHIAITLETTRAAKLELERVTLEKEAAFQKEIQNLLDNLSQAVFNVNAQGEVVAPVSKFTETIFGQDLPGKSVYQTVYKDLPQDSESLSKTRSGLALIYGEDEFQWDFAEGDLVRQLAFHHPEKGERILRVDYKPFWNEENRLERLMYVVEDATDLIALEKQVEKAKAENAKRMQILGELADVKRQFLIDYFKTSSRFLDDCREIIDSPAFSEKREGTAPLLRHLHTLKGNSRLCHLSGVATCTHEVENEVLRLLDQDKKSEIDVQQLITSLKNQVDRVESEFLNYLELAERIFGIENDRQTRWARKLHETLLDWDKESLERNPSASSELQKNLSSQLPAWEKTQDHSLEPLIQSAHHYLNSSDPDASARDWVRQAVSTLKTRKVYTPLSVDSSHWKEAFHQYFRLCQFSNPSEQIEPTIKKLGSLFELLKVPSLTQLIKNRGPEAKEGIGTFLSHVSRENFRTLYSSRSLLRYRNALEVYCKSADGNSQEKLLSITRKGCWLAEWIRDQLIVAHSLSKGLGSLDVHRLLEDWIPQQKAPESNPMLTYKTQASYLFEVDLARLTRTGSTTSEDQVSLIPVLENATGMVPEIASRLGKKVHCEIAGEALRLDSSQASLISDALVHLIRNSLDHGLETPEERSQNQKPEAGTLDLEIYTSPQGEAILSIRDDGRGIDGERILAKALQSGRITPEQAEQMTLQQKQELIYLPSFSTKDVATDLSGRGVGMDVVKSNIERLGGVLELHSTPGAGTEFKIRIAQNSG